MRVDGKLIPPMLTQADIDAITSPRDGEVVRNTDRNEIQEYSGGEWLGVRTPPKFKYQTIQIVQSLSDLPAPVGSEIQLDDVIYFIDADLDITGYTLVFGAKSQINGFGQNVSVIRSSTAGAGAGSKYVFFKSTTNMFMNDLEIVCEGTNQRIWQHEGDGTVLEGESFELNRFNCLSFPASGPGHGNEMGYIKDIRQGFIGTFSAFGFENGFTCAGAWTGGFRVQNTLFSADNSGVFFGSDPLDPVTFQLRMASNANLTVPAGSIGYDFPPTAFSFTGQYQLQEGNVSGAGQYVTDWFGQSPAFNKLANFQDNTGIQNTFQGGEWENDTNTTTSLTQNVWTQISVNTVVQRPLTWFTEASGVFTYEGGNPLDVTIQLILSLTGKSNDVIEVKLVKEDSLAVQTDLKSNPTPMTIQGTTSQGRADSVPIITTAQLVEGDKILVFIRNTSGNSNVTTAAGSNCVIGAK